VRPHDTIANKMETKVKVNFSSISQPEFSKRYCSRYGVQSALRKERTHVFVVRRN